MADPAAPFEDDTKGAESTSTRIDRGIAAVDKAVTDYAGVVVLAFLAITVLMLGGVGQLSTQAGAGQFTQDVPAQQALEDIEEEFATGIGSSETTAQLFVIERDGNVLSRPTMTRVLETQERLESRADVRVESTSSYASVVAQRLDPSAQTPAEQKDAIEEATASDLSGAIDDSASVLSGQLSEDYNPTAGTAEVALLNVVYDVPGSAETARISALQERSVAIVDGVPGNEAGTNILLFGDGILNSEVSALLTDTAIVVFPAAILLILGFLLFSYRDPFDVGLGLAALVVTMVWTLGFMGYVGIPFSDSIVSVIPLLLAVGIDFGIHIINRYREERAEGRPITGAMRATTDQLLIAFLLVVLTTVFSFAANLVSDLQSTQDFGIVAAIGMIVTFLSFGIFLPAAKVLADRGRAAIGVPAFGSSALGTGDSAFARLLQTGATLARVAPRLVVVVIVVTAAISGAYGTGVETEFSEEAFFPAEDRIDLYESFPEPFAPTQYTFLDTLSILEEDFNQGFVGSITLYVDQSVRDDPSLELIDRTTRNPPDSFATAEPGQADATSIVTVIEDYADQNPEFAATVNRNDRTGNGVPDRNIGEVYDELLASPQGEQARGYLAEDRGSARVDIQVEPDADTTAVVADAQQVADRSALTIVPTGQLVVNQAVIDVLLESAINSLIIAFVLTAIVLVIGYRLLEGRTAYGIINLVPVLVAVAFLVGSMVYFEIPLSPITAPILSVSIGLGVDYTVHFTHRFVDEFENRADIEEALAVTLAGTGGALTGSMLTTVTGLGVLYIALIPLIQDFGVLLALGVFYAYLASIVLVPSLVVLWDRYLGL